MDKTTFDSLVLSTIYEIPESPNLDETCDVIIIEKLSETKDEKFATINYLDSCYKKSLAHSDAYQSRTLGYMKMYYDGIFNEDHQLIFLEWLLNNNVPYIADLILMFDNTIDIIENIYKSVKASSESKSLTVIKNIYSNTTLQKKLVDIYSTYEIKTGIEEENKGFFSWISKNYSSIDVVNVVIPLLEHKELVGHICLLIGNIIKKNIAYTYSNIKQTVTKKCSSIIFLRYVFDILVEIYDRYSKDVEKEFTEPFPRTEFSVFSTDNLAVKIYVLLSSFYTVFYAPLRNMYSAYVRDYNKIKKMGESKLYTSKTIIKNKLDQLEKEGKPLVNIATDLKYCDTVRVLATSLGTNTILKQNDDFVGAFVMATGNELSNDHDMKLGDEIFEYLLQIVNGTITRNPHTRYFAYITINSIIEKSGCCDKYTKILLALLKYIIEVNAEEIVSPKLAYAAFRSALTNISIVSIMANKYIPEPFITENMAQILKCIHFISSKNIASIDWLKTHCAEIYQDIDNLSQEDKIYLKEDYVHIINSKLLTTTISIQTMCDMSNHLLKNIKLLSSEVIMPMVSIITTLISFLCDGKNPIYTVYEMNMVTLELLQNMFKLINIIKDNKNFKTEITDYVDHVKEMLGRVKLPPQSLAELKTYFDNFVKETVDMKSIPDEFIDQILCIPIKDPIMIPNVDLVFDKTSIMYQLNIEEKNPYTREELTAAQLEAYNKTESVITKINAFKTKLNEWIANNKN